MRRKRSTKIKRRKGKAPLVVLFIILTGLSIFIIWYILTLPYFYIKNVEIKGLQRLSPEQLLKGEFIPPQTSIFEVDIREIFHKIQKEAAVKKVKIKKKLPSTLLIEVEERLPYAYVGKKGKLWEVDEEGVVLGEVKNLGSRISITGIDPFKEKDALLKALKALKFSQSLNLGVEKIAVKNRNEGIVLVLKENIQVIMGTSPHYDYLSYLPYIFQDAREKGEKFNTVDLRFDDQIIISNKQKIR